MHFPLHWDPAFPPQIFVITIAINVFLELLCALYTRNAVCGSVCLTPKHSPASHCATVSMHTLLRQKASTDWKRGARLSLKMTCSLQTPGVLFRGADATVTRATLIQLRVTPPLEA
ncbi:hypothetical protein COCON_G00080710 [Conger conger]|uniref:Uncharacterized protein n=1 Tax=Conger conger TaxID=82655 RepID=A0A9Q1I0W1_CONCO|nr:hypothetical protein COCON_G00080710 [Conger conger]